MSDYADIALRVDDRGVAHLELARPEAHNALAYSTIVELEDAVDRLADESQARVVILSGQGKSFCAGADLKWMQGNLGRARGEMISETRRLADMLGKLNRLPQVVIGRVHGAAYGGGLGMISVCDIAVGTSAAKFALTEVKLGLTPATISPFVVQRIGRAAARRIALSAHAFDAAHAVAIGLLSHVVDESELDAAVDREVQAVLACAPGAVAATKRLIEHVASGRPEEHAQHTAERLADAWETEETKEGIGAWRDKRAPAWRPPSD